MSDQKKKKITKTGCCPAKRLCWRVGERASPLSSLARPFLGRYHTILLASEHEYAFRFFPIKARGRALFAKPKVEPFPDASRV